MISDTAGYGTGGLVKTGPGLLVLAGANTYSGTTSIAAGALEAVDGTGLPTATNLAFSGGVYQSNSNAATFTRPLGQGADTVQWLGSGGFSARGGNFTVNINGGLSDPLVWGSTAQFLPNGSSLMFGSVSANSVVTMQNNIDLNGGSRTVQVTAGTGGDYAVLSGSLIDSSIAQTGALVKAGNGLLSVTASNNIPGGTTLQAGTLSLGNSGAGTGRHDHLQRRHAPVHRRQHAGLFRLQRDHRPHQHGGQPGVQPGHQRPECRHDGQSDQQRRHADQDRGRHAGPVGHNLFGGGTNINGGVLSLASTSALSASGILGTGPITFGGGTLQFTASNTLDYSGSFSTAAQPISIDTNGQNVTFGAADARHERLADGQRHGAAPGMLILAASNNYTGGTAITAGEIKLNGLTWAAAFAGFVGGQRPGRGLDHVQRHTGPGGDAADGGAERRERALITDLQTGGGGPGSNGVTPLTVSFDVGSSTFGGSIADGPTAQLSLTKSGSATLVLSGQNTYTGGTEVAAGELVLANLDALDGGGSLAVDAGPAGGVLFGGGAAEAIRARWTRRWPCPSRRHWSCWPPLERYWPCGGGKELRA